MKHKLKISVSKKPQTGGIVTCKSLTVRERLLKFLLGDKRRVTVLIPGDSIGEIAICEAEKEEDVNGQGKNLVDDRRNSFRETILITSLNCHTPRSPTAN